MTESDLKGPVEAPVGAGVEAHPAATVVLLRPGPSGPEVLLGRRPASMAFAPDVHVFPGGRVDPADAHPSVVTRSVRSPEDAAASLGGDLYPTTAVAAYIAAIREAFEEAGVLMADCPPSSPGMLGAARSALVGGEIGFQALAAQLDLTLRTDWLLPLSRWVTPSGYPRRFDARFFVAALPEGSVATIEGDEVADQAWMRPTDALAAMADDRLALWLPTSATLQQLEYVTSIDDVAARLTPGSLGAVVVEDVADGVLRIEMPAGGGVAGQPVNAYLVGRAAFVLVDPGDPTGPGLDRVMAEVAVRGGRIAAIALTCVDADHAGGAEGLAEELGIPILVGPGGGRPLPHKVRESADGEVIDAGDIPLRVVVAPGPRPDHIVVVVGDGAVVLSGDLDGRRGARSIPGPADETAWTASRLRVAAAAPGARQLSAHPAD